jgi:hypothetical protein
MIILKIAGVTLVTVVTKAAFIGLVTISHQSIMASIDIIGDTIFANIEAGNATTIMTTNSTADGHTTAIVLHGYSHSPVWFIISSQ